MKFFNKQITVKDLINIDEGRIERSGNLEKVELDDVYYFVKEETWLDKFTNFFKNKPKEIFYDVFKYKVKSDSGKEYTVFIEIPPNFDYHKFLSNRVQVFCDCPDFKFRAAYNLSKKDNVYLNDDIREHLGIALTEPPTKVIPTNICKHIYAAIFKFKNSIKSTPDLLRM